MDLDNILGILTMGNAEAFILLSEEILIMYTKIFAVRCQRMEFMANWANKVEYMVR